MSDQHFSESVIELAVSRDAPLAVSATIPVQLEIVSGASGSIVGGKAELFSLRVEPNMDDSYARMKLPTPKVSVTSSTTANQGVDPGLLCSSLQPESEEKKEEGSMPR